jgi:proteasome lid subunit RPN8/RPN11
VTGSGRPLDARPDAALGGAVVAPDARLDVPIVVALPFALRDAIVAHALAGLPNEACGIVVGGRPAVAGGRALRFVPARNAAASPSRYEMDARDLLRLTLEADDSDEVFWAIVHSHPRGEPRPSPADVADARYPEAIHVIVGPLDATRPPEVRAWWIAGPDVREIALEIGPAAG